MYGQRPFYYTNPIYHVSPMPVYLNHYLGRQYPEVDAESFKHSAESFSKLMSDASQLFGKLAESPNLAYNVMDAAQKNEKERVKQLIASSGVKGDVDVSYTPDSLEIEMKTDAEGTQCCRLTMVLRW